jgi:hypothetical protein
MLYTSCHTLYCLLDCWSDRQSHTLEILMVSSFLHLPAAVVHRTSLSYFPVLVFALLEKIWCLFPSKGLQLFPSMLVGAVVLLSKQTLSRGVQVQLPRESSSMTKGNKCVVCWWEHCAEAKTLKGGEQRVVGSRSPPHTPQPSIHSILGQSALHPQCLMMQLWQTLCAKLYEKPCCISTHFCVCKNVVYVCSRSSGTHGRPGLCATDIDTHADQRGVMRKQSACADICEVAGTACADTCSRTCS